MALERVISIINTLTNLKDENIKKFVKLKKKWQTERILEMS